MKRNYKNLVIVLVIALSWSCLSFIAWINPIEQISESERRNLAQLPKIELSAILSGEYMKDFEDYAKDQFPQRFWFRTVKAYTRFYLLFQKDNNNIYIEDDYAAKLEYPLNEKSIDIANKKFNYLYNKYMKYNNHNIYISVIPDKGYYLGAKNGYPTMDYEKLFKLIKEGNTFAQYIDIADLLSIEDYYKTDIHWKQESLENVAMKLALKLGISDSLLSKFEKNYTDISFYGVYYGQSALPLKPDEIVFLTNDTIKNSIVYNLETDSESPVYNMEKLRGRDPYDVFLSGAAPILIVDNCNLKSDKELVVFRDSFGSSLIPLLLEGYSKITLVDIRYIASDLIGNYVDFNNQDILFLYSTSILNSADMFK